MDSNNVSEAMGLAGMNPVVGVPADHSHRGSLIVNVTNHDKDLEDDGKRMTTVARNLDMDDNLYGIDRFGKVFAKKKYEVMEKPDVWEDDIVEVFKVNKDCEPTIEQLEKEASLPYDKRPIHKPTYIYEAITGHTMYTEDQMYYDRLLEKVELEKMSAVLSGASGGLGRQKNLEQKGNKDAGYIPDNDFPSGTENMNTGIVLASADMSIDKKIDDCNYIASTLTKKERKDVDGIEDNGDILFLNVKYDHDEALGFICCKKPLKKDINPKVKDCYAIIAVKEEARGKGIATSLVKSMIKWFKKSNYEQLCWPCQKTNEASNKLAKKCGFTYAWSKDNGKSNVYIMTNPSLLKSIGEGALKEWEQNGRDLKLLREISNMKIELDKDTIYSTNEGFFSNLKQKFNDTRYSLARKGNEYIKYPNAIYRISDKICYRPYTPDLNYAIMDYLIDVNPELKGKKVSDKIEISKEWWEKHKNDRITFEMYNYPEPVKKNRMYAINFVNYDTKGMVLPMDLEDLVNSYNGIQVSIKESTSLHNGMLSLLGIEEDSGYKSNPIVFSDDDVYINFDKFTSGKEHVLFITGLSGAGKSTLGEKLGKKYNAYYVETDIYAFAIGGFSEKRFKYMNFKYIDENDKMLGKYLREKNIPPDIMKDINFSNYDSSKKKIWESRVNDYIKWLIDEQKERVVIAGGSVAVFLQNYPKYCDIPTIFKGTSLFKSIYRRIFVRSDRTLLDQFKRFPRTMKQYRKMWSEVNTARLHVMGSNDWDYIREHTSLSDGLFSLLGLQESSNNPRFLTQTKIPYDCEVKNCYWTMQGPIKKGQPNLILHHKNKNWRIRAELLLFKEDKVFLHKESKMTQYGTYYRIPGGGIDDPKEYIEKAACRECEEECLVIPKNVQYTGKTVFKVYEVQPYWHSQTLNKNGIYYDGSVSFICTGEYDKKYTKYVRKMDQDSMKNGAFYSYDEVKDLLSKEHKKIFEDHLNKK